MIMPLRSVIVAFLISTSLFSFPLLTQAQGSFSAYGDNYFEGMDQFSHFGPPGKVRPGATAWELQTEYSEQEKMDKALPYAEMNVRAAPSNAELQYLLARNYLLLNRLKEAMFHYNWALQLDPGHRENDVSTANIGHIGKMLNVDMAAWNRNFKRLLVKASTGASIGSDDDFDFLDEWEDWDEWDDDDDDEDDDDDDDEDEDDEEEDDEDDWADGDVKLPRTQGAKSGGFSAHNDL